MGTKPSVAARVRDRDCSDSKNISDGTDVKSSRRGKISKNRILEYHGYTWGRLIGSGSYATVKLAHSKRHGRDIAIKIVSKDKYGPDDLVKYLPREIDVVKELQHENLIRYYEAIETPHRVYIVMEYAENGSLFSFIEKNQRQDENTARKWFKQLVSAVKYCHDNGIVHRDLKCENLLLDDKYRIKLSDFGFARKNMIGKDGNMKTCNTFCGSVAYASPEVLMGIPYRPNAADIWSMGVILFAIVIGFLPFDDLDKPALTKLVKDGVVFPPDDCTISNDCKQMITKLLAPLKNRLTIVEIKAQPWYRYSQTNIDNCKRN